MTMGRRTGCALVMTTLLLEPALSQRPLDGPNDWAYSENFEALAAGQALHGQGGWRGHNVSGEKNYTVQAGIAYEGSKAVSVPITTHSTIYRDLPKSTSHGSVYIALRKTANDLQDFGVTLRDTGGSNRMFVALNASGNIQAYNHATSSYVTVSAYSADTWYPINIEFNDTSQPDRYRVRVCASGSWSKWTDWLLVNGGSYSLISTLVLDTEWAGGSRSIVGYADAISPTTIGCN